MVIFLGHVFGLCRVNSVQYLGLCNVFWLPFALGLPLGKNLCAGVDQNNIFHGLDPIWPSTSTALQVQRLSRDLWTHLLVKLAWDCQPGRRIETGTTLGQTWDCFEQLDPVQ
jgi:hypothetical protein